MHKGPDLSSCTALDFIAIAEPRTGEGTGMGGGGRGQEGAFSWSMLMSEKHKEPCCITSSFLNITRSRSGGVYGPCRRRMGQSVTPHMHVQLGMQGTNKSVRNVRTWHAVPDLYFSGASY